MCVCVCVCVYCCPVTDCFVLPQLFSVESTPNVLSWDLNPSKFTLDLVSNRSAI